MNTIRLAVALGTVAIAASAQAALIAPGGSALAAAEPGPTGGTVLATTTLPFATAGYSGTLTSQVISGDSSNPLGGLTFTYAIQTDPTGTNGITRLAVNGYTGFQTDLSYLAGSGTVAPSLMDRDNTGDVVGYRYVGAPLGAGTIMPGNLTNLMVVQTDAVLWQRNIAIVIDGSSTQVDSFSPLVVPEPASLGALGLVGATLRRRRR